MRRRAIACLLTGSGSLVDANAKANILICDDNPGNILALEVVLEGLGENVVTASSGEEALRHVHRGDFAVIVLDVCMPGLGGLETARLIRGRKKTRHTPIIFLTAHRDDDRLLEGYEVGAVDYLTKPVAPEVLSSKVRIFVDLYRMNQEVQRRSEEIRLLQARQHQQQLAAAVYEMEAIRMRTELAVGQQIQRALYPAAQPDCPGFEMYGESRAAGETSGDYFDYLQLADGQFALVVADVCGHGVGPAMLMASVRAYLRALARTHVHPGEILTLVNQLIAADVEQRLFVTLLLVKLDPVARTITYASAGHPTGYILDDAGQVCQLLPAPVSRWGS